MKSALVLFAHGSRNALWREPFERIAAQVAQQTTARVELAFLEQMQPTLSEVLDVLVEQKHHLIKIVPLFFGLGNHVANDLQHIVSTFEQSNPDVKIQIAAPLGESEMVLHAMAQYALNCLDSQSLTDQNDAGCMG